MVWAMVIVVVTVQAVVVVKTVIVWEPSAAKMAGVVCAAEAMRTVILTKPEMVAAKAAQVAGTKTTHVVAAAKATDMTTAEASAPDVTAAAEASASHVTAATPSAATRFRCGR
jgi:hypothetical protein